MQAPSIRRVEPPLKHARALSERPACIPAPTRLKGAKAAGLRFERALHKALPYSIHGQWFEFEDSKGYGLCQTDLLCPYYPSFNFSSPGLIIVIEAKYTLVPGAHSKLSSLYIPIVEKALSTRAAGVVIVKNLDPRFRRGKIFTNIEAAAQCALESGYPSLIHWSGQSLLRPSQGSKRAARSDAATPNSINQGAIS